jgi:hypothetical protein
MTQYVIMVAKQFQATHSRKGQQTNFKEFILDKTKIHTIRGNYNLWAKRFEKIKAGKAVLSLREWSGKPYRSKQDSIIKLGLSDGIGLQKLTIMDIHNGHLFFNIGNDYLGLSSEELAPNDGLDVLDFQEWFKKAKIGDELAIIHFTNFRYE